MEVTLVGILVIFGWGVAVCTCNNYNYYFILSFYLKIVDGDQWTHDMILQQCMSHFLTQGKVYSVN